MAKFCNGSGVSAVLTEVITNAEKKLCIISPYLKIPMQTKNYLKAIDDKKFQFTIIYRTDSSLNDDDLRFFKNLNYLDLRCCDNLHTKCYINEKEGLITSMNLHEHSQVSNWEMGIRFSKQNDPEIFADVVKELNFIINASKSQPLKQKNQETKQNNRSNTSLKSTQKTVYKPKEAPNKGLFTKLIDSVIGEAYCIRCGQRMDKFDLQKPLCEICYPKWAKFKKVDYPENNCHACGQTKSNITYGKPICLSCYNQFYK